jgi:excisionase family DNA binding protein
MGVTVKQAAARLEVSPATVYALVAAGKLRCVRVGLGRGAIRILEAHIDEYLRGAEPKPALPQPALPSHKPKHIKIR